MVLHVQHASHAGCKISFCRDILFVHALIWPVPRFSTSAASCHHQSQYIVRCMHLPTNMSYWLSFVRLHLPHTCFYHMWPKVVWGHRTSIMASHGFRNNIHQPHWVQKEFKSLDWHNTQSFPAITQFVDIGYESQSWLSSPFVLGLFCRHDQTCLDL